MTVVWMFGWVTLVLALGLFGWPRWRTDRPKWPTIACAVGFTTLPPLEQWVIYRVAYVASGEPVGGLIGGSIVAMAMWKYYAAPFVALWVVYLIVLVRRRRCRVRSGTVGGIR
ncbi:hypothetical protein [Micropruina sp.]|uniref:hypothetical protein n=1 Tax=Micropruina sp. TaxID=2737536 RepID=UPI0039E308B6